MFVLTTVLAFPGLGQETPQTGAAGTTNAARASTRSRYPSFARSELNQAATQIREEGMDRSQAMETLAYLTEVIGPRLTASPGHKRASEWTKEKMESWGLCNARLEPFGPFGRGWSVKRFSMQVVEPQFIPLVAAPSGWSPGLEKPVVGEVVHIDRESELEQYSGKLKGAIVLISPSREVRQRFEPLATRLSETNLLRLANAAVPSSQPRQFDSPRGGENRPRTNAPGTNAAPRPLRGRERLLSFLTKEGAAMAVSCSPAGDVGTIFVGNAWVPMADPDGQPGFGRPWSTNAGAAVAQVTLGAEDYNRLVRATKRGEKLKVAAELQVEYQDQDLMAYNTIAEIPGTDLSQEIVMLGAHLDSVHVGTGATDNAVGVAAMMEAARIIKATKLAPRRTIRVGLWSGEEQGLLGSRAYVTRHLGYYTNATSTRALKSPKQEGEDASPADEPPRTERKLVKLPEYEKFAAYFNLDNGAGKIRGIHLQGNEAARPLFRAWLDRFRDLGAETIASSNTYGTDHLSFDAIGLPGFQFIQDPLDYGTRTHHATSDTYDRVPEEDLKQASVIIATLAYNAAMIDERFPRKDSAEGERRGR